MSRRPRPVLRRASGSPDVWSEHGSGGLVVHAPGVILRAPATCPSDDVRESAERLRAAFLFGGAGDPADADRLLAAAFGDQPLARLSYSHRLACMAHVLKAWGLGVAWR